MFRPMKSNTREATPIHTHELYRTLNPWPIKPVELSRLVMRFEVPRFNVLLA